MGQKSDPKKWAQKNLKDANFTDVRRIDRLVDVGEVMARSPGETIPRLLDRWYDVKATYALFRHPEVTPDNIQAGHRKLVEKELRKPGLVTLLLEDTSEVSWNTSFEIPGLGPTGDDNPRVKGFHLHSVLAVRWGAEVEVDGPYRRAPVEILGLAHQLYHIRKPVPPGEDPNRSSGPRKQRQRESMLWNDCTEQLGPAPNDTSWVRVCDRGADVYEFLAGCQAMGHGFVVRASQNRVLVSPNGKLFDVARQLDAWAEFCLHVGKRPKRPAHEAHLLIAACPVVIRSPDRPGANAGKLPPVECTVVRVWEPHPPKGAEPLEWILLTDQPVESLEQALTVSLQYSTRWVIEDFHKALKTGMGVERLRLEDGHALMAATSLMSLTALRLVDLRERLRISPDAPASDSGLSPIELKILAMKTKRYLKTTQDVALAIGRLGGHLNRAADGMPGLVTLWHGFVKLQTLVDGATYGLRISRFG